MKNLVWGAVGANNELFNTFALEWGISLRYLANYNGDACILDYGLEEKTRNVLKKLDIRLFPCMSRGFDMIGNTRYVDVFDIINMNYFDYNIALFDIDIWFQDNLNSLFKRISKKEDGILFATEKKDIIERNINRGPNDTAERIKIRSQYIKLAKHYGGLINSGFFAGQFRSVLIKLTNIKTMFANLYEIPRWATEQFFVNILFDYEIDEANAYKWNCVIPDLYLRDGIFYTNRLGEEEKVVGVHCYGSEYSDPSKMKNYKSIKEYHFHYNYPDLFEEHSK
jgi:hypothetical protein